MLKNSRQKALLKAKQAHGQQLKGSKSKMVVSIPNEGSSPSAPSPVATSKINGNNSDVTKPNEHSESEYSSLEDDDDFAAGRHTFFDSQTHLQFFLLL